MRKILFSDLVHPDRTSTVWDDCSDVSGGDASDHDDDDDYDEDDQTDCDDAD